MDMWAKFDQFMSASAPLFAAAVMFTCGAIVGWAVKDWYDNVPDYSDDESEDTDSERENDGESMNGGDVIESDTDNESDADADVESDADNESGGDVVESDIEPYDGMEPDDLACMEPEIHDVETTLIEPVEFCDSDAEDPFLIDDVYQEPPALVANEVFQLDDATADALVAELVEEMVAELAAEAPVPEAKG